MERNYSTSPEHESEQERFLKEEAYLKAKEKVKKIKGFYSHLTVYILVNIFLIVLFNQKFNDNFWSFGTFSTAIFWGIGLMFHALGVFGPDLIFGKSWENKMIKKYMDKEKNSRWE